MSMLPVEIPAADLVQRTVIAQSAPELEQLAAAAMAELATAAPAGVLVGVALGGGGAGSFCVLTIVGSSSALGGGIVWASAVIRVIEALERVGFAEEFERVRAAQALTGINRLVLHEQSAPSDSPKTVYAQVWGPAPA